MKTEIINSVIIIHLSRTILQPDSELLQNYFDNLYYQKTDKVIMDFTNTDHICSSALGHMVYMKNRLKVFGGDIKLVIQDEDLLELMDITMMNQVFKIYNSIDSALSSFNQI